MNVCTFIGRLGKDPDMRYTQNGKAVASFSLAISRDGKKDETDWIDFIAWEKTAELIANYCHKGDLIGVTGQLQQRSWEKDGQKRTAHEVKVNRIDFCGGGKKNAAPAPVEMEAAPVEMKVADFQVIDDDGELPF